MLAAIEPGERGDLLAQLAFPLPVTVIAELLGIPAADREQFKRWSTQVTSSLRGNVCPYRAVKSFQASRELRSYLSKIARAKESDPANDLLSTLVQNQGEGRLSEGELLSNSVLLLIAGHETTVNLIGNGMLALMDNPEQLSSLIGRSSLAEPAVEELLRFTNPVQFGASRIALEDPDQRVGLHAVGINCHQSGESFRAHVADRLDDVARMQRRLTPVKLEIPIGRDRRNRLIEDRGVIRMISAPGRSVDRAPRTSPIAEISLVEI